MRFQILIEMKVVFGSEMCTQLYCNRFYNFLCCASNHLIFILRPARDEDETPEESSMVTYTRTQVRARTLSFFLKLRREWIEED